MTFGIPGFMEVNTRKVRTTDDGARDYIRIQLPDGSWRTKRVIAGKFVRVRPRKRPFHFLSTKQEKKIENLAFRYIDRL